MKIALFPGSFDPFTIGHASVVERGLAVFDKIIIAIGVNAEKKTMFTLEQRMEQISACYCHEPRVEVCSYQGMTVNIAKEKQASVILRSVRTVADFEYERNMATLNKILSDKVETLILFAEPKYEHLQSSVVRELISYGQDISACVPKEILKCIESK